MNKTLIVRTTFKSISGGLVIACLLVLASIIFTPRVHAAAGACTAPTTDYGTVTQSVTITGAGTYYGLVRMEGLGATTPTILLDIDGANCFTVGGSSVGQNSWVWLSKDTSNAVISKSFTTGSHTIKMYGNADGVGLDRIVFTQDASCVPTGTGDNCANPADTTKPTVAITAPANAAVVSGTVSVTATASDDSGTVSKVEYYIDGATTAAATDTSAPYTYSWNTTGLVGGSSHTITAKAYDPSGNNQSASVTVTIQTALVPGDTDANTKVNILDLLAVLNHWNGANQTRANGELDGNSPVNIGDLLQVLNNWSP